ncbi:hypothetical protein [Haloferax marisrubri]|uniref:Uncharacterized protein n=1 Tax=Haloferax marisrubri TaxID=1544719 RepID=A0A2P4NU89_9EURY|nr:hypothetical protein [Haloferax marisrubri]POG56683.1 hypothetical protein AUR65_002320 [Haloferax marisrubri]
MVIAPSRDSPSAGERVDPRTPAEELADQLGGGGDDDDSPGGGNNHDLTTTDPTIAGDSPSSNDSFDPDDQTLGSGSLGTDLSTDDGTSQTGDPRDSNEVDVDDSSDPSDSSPAGGAGMWDAIDRFTGSPDGTTEQIAESGGNPLEFSQAVSDVLSEMNISEAMPSLLTDGLDADGESSDSRLLAIGAAAVAVVGVGLAAVVGGDDS